MSWESRMSERTKAREAARLEARIETGIASDEDVRMYYSHDIIIRDGKIVYPKGYAVCEKCGLESDLEYVADHDCPAPHLSMPCACWGGGPDGQQCCQPRYLRRLRFLHQRIANVFMARTETLRNYWPPRNDDDLIMGDIDCQLGRMED